MIQNGRERIISYDGRGLHASERNYSSCKLELLAVVIGMQHYHEFLAPKPFLLRSDNSALKYLNSAKHVVEKLGR